MEIPQLSLETVRRKASELLLMGGNVFSENIQYTFPH